MSSHVLEDLLEVFIVDLFSKVALHMVTNECLIFILIDPLQHLDLFLIVERVFSHLLQLVLLLHCWVGPNWKNRLVLLLVLRLSWDQF